MKSPAPALALVGRTRRMASKMEATNAEQWRLVKFIVGLSPPATETRRKGFKECGGTLSIAQPQGAAVYKPPRRQDNDSIRAVWKAPLLASVFVAAVCDRRALS